MVIKTSLQELISPKFQRTNPRQPSWIIFTTYTRTWNDVSIFIIYPIMQLYGPFYNTLLHCTFTMFTYMSLRTWLIKYNCIQKKPRLLKSICVYIVSEPNDIVLTPYHIRTVWVNESSDEGEVTQVGLWSSLWLFNHALIFSIVFTFLPNSNCSTFS